MNKLELKKRIRRVQGLPYEIDDQQFIKWMYFALAAMSESFPDVDEAVKGLIEVKEDRKYNDYRPTLDYITRMYRGDYKRAEQIANEQICILEVLDQ